MVSSAPDTWPHIICAPWDLLFVETVESRSDEARRELAARFGVPGVYGSLADGRSQPDVVHVLTPPASHRALALEALSMGCHVLVEKPMAENAEECEEMIARARENDRVLSVNHSARFDPAVLQAAEAVRRGVCGDVLAVLLFEFGIPPIPEGPFPHPIARVHPFRDLGVHGLPAELVSAGEICGSRSTRPDESRC